MDCPDIDTTLKMIAENYRPGTLKEMEINTKIWSQLTHLENEINQASLSRDKERMSQACQNYGLLIMVNTIFDGSLIVTGKQEPNADAKPQPIRNRLEPGEGKEKNMKVSEMFPSKFLTKDDLTEPTIFTIDTVVMEEVQNEDGKENKPILYFYGVEEKPLILNKTNAETLEKEFGKDSKDWENKEIEIYVDPSIRFGKKVIGGIRVRISDTSKVEETL